MKKIAMQGWGGQLVIFNGARAQPVNLTFVSSPSESLSIGQAKGLDVTSTMEYDRAFYGGTNTMLPWGCANHRGIVMYKDKIYQCLNSADPTQGHFYLVTWDGSGVYNHQGTEYETSPSRCGRGTELLTPSGTSALKSNDLCLLEHNGIMLAVGSHWGLNDSGANSLIADFEWAWDKTAYPVTSIYGRNYRALSIDSNGKKIGSPAKSYGPNADYRQHLGGCDALSFNGDVYYANWIDVLKFPEGSGIAQILSPEKRMQPSSRSLSLFPEEGYSNSVPQGDTKILMLSGSGTIHQINPSSGLDRIVDLTSVSLGWTARTTDNFYARVASATDEPGRSCLLMNANNRLHAFVVSATSGYRYLSCTGDPSGTTNWTDYSANLPANIWNLDGNIYGQIDPKNNQLYIAHVTQGNVGIYGHEGCNRSAGAISIYRQNSVQSWTEITSTMVGMPPRGMMIYNPVGPHIHVASGLGPTIYKSLDYAIVEYAVYDHYSRNVDVVIEFSDDKGASWDTARRFRDYSTGVLAGSGIKNLPTSPEGISYDFYWDYVNDIGFDTKKATQVRIRPQLKR